MSEAHYRYGKIEIPASQFRMLTDKAAEGDRSIEKLHKMQTDMAVKDIHLKNGMKREAELADTVYKQSMEIVELKHYKEKCRRLELQLANILNEKNPITSEELK